MKKIFLAAVLLSSSFASAHSPICTGDIECGALTSTMVTLSPTFLTGAVTEAVLENNIMMVKGEAVIALETGVISAELQSVIEALRMELATKGHKQMTDMEILQLIAE